MYLKIEREDRVLRITLNRPEKRNALTMDMCSDLVGALVSVQNDSQIGSVLIDSEGNVFCGGMDLEEAATVNSEELAKVHDKLFNIGACSLKPIVICANGPALGSGLALVAQGHVVVAAQGSLFGFPEVRVGLWPLISFQAIEAAIGLRRAQEISLTGRMFSTTEALQWGLIHQVSAPFEADDRAAAIARDLARASPRAVSTGMQFVRVSRGKTPAQMRLLAMKMRTRLMDGPDFKEGHAAFKEKRSPKWPSRRAAIETVPTLNGVSPSGIDRKGKA